MTPFIDPARAALLVIDLQNGFCHDDSAMGRSVGVAAQRAIIAPIGELVALCRQRAVPILWTQQEHFPDDALRARRLLPSHAARQGFLPCLRGSWEVAFEAQIAQLIAPSDHVVAKHRASAFYNTNLESKLRMLGTQVLLIAGCNTEFCVEGTVRDAYARDYDLVVVRDCVAGIRREFHEDSLRKFAAYFAEVRSLNEVASLFL